MKPKKYIAVANVAFRHTTDLDLSTPISGARLGELTSRCISTAVAALQCTAAGYTRDHRNQIADVFNSLNTTHRTIRRLLNGLTADDPESVDALSLLRLQFESLFAICLMLEDSKYVDWYVQDYWRKLYAQYLLIREECGTLPSKRDYLKTALPALVSLRDFFGISEAHQVTVEYEELGIPLPDGITAQPLAEFPTPGRVPREIILPDKKRMLERLRFDYGYLCSFSHVLGQANLLKGLFDIRSMHRHDAQVSEAELKDKHDELVVSPSNLNSFLCVAQSVAELTVLYPNDEKLMGVAKQAWSTVFQSSLLAQMMWIIRTRSVLGL